MREYLTGHLQTFVSCLGRMWRAPLPTFFTVAVVGIILSLPIGLFVLAENLKTVTNLWQGNPEISIFLSTETSENSAMELRERVQRIPEVENAHLIPASVALEEFKEITGLESIIEYVSDNPLPAVIVVRPRSEFTLLTQMQLLANQLRELEHVDSVQIDLEWVQRLHALIELLRIAFSIVSVLLILAAIMLICNTTRLSITNRLEEITVIDQVGGTRSFIRRPFVYIAVIHGILSSAVAGSIITSIVALMKNPVTKLATLYSSDFQLTGLSWTIWGTVVAASAVLCWLAARITVNLYLRKLAPN